MADAATISECNKYHYTYKITNTTNGMIYIGVRSCKCVPELDSGYMSSSKYVHEAIELACKSNFTKEILGMFATRYLANVAEEQLLKEVDAKNNALYYNKSNGAKDFYFYVNDMSEDDRNDFINSVCIPNLKKANTKEANAKSREGVLKAWASDKERLVALIHHNDRDYTKQTNRIKKFSGTGKSRLKGSDRTEAQKQAAVKLSENILAGGSTMHSKEANAKRAKTMTGVKKPLHSESMTGRKHMIKEGVQRSIKESDVQEYIKDGWVLGSKHVSGYTCKSVTCPHCGKVGAGGNMTRYHMNNCKFKNKQEVA